MLVGSQTNTLDAKNRVFVPASFRADLGEQFILTFGMDANSLYIYPMDAWKAFEEKLMQLSRTKAANRDLRRYYTSKAMLCEPDGQGRIVMPQEHKDHAGIIKEVLFIGTIDGIEVWAPENMKVSSPEEITQKMEDLDFDF